MLNSHISYNYYAHNSLMFKKIIIPFFYEQGVRHFNEPRENILQGR